MKQGVFAMKKSVTIVLLIAVFGAAAAWAQYRWPNMTTVQKVYVGKLGNNDDAERFRDQLAVALRDIGFTPWDEEEGADGIIKGTFSFQNYSDKSGAAANLRIMSPDNKEIWGLSVSDPKSERKGDSSLWVAGEVAKRMKKQKEDEIKWFKGKKG